ncbi:radical SAM protein [Thermoanaerobacterium sp. RBIITD]|uniref:radical SAM protein n=1 Tax=Thermoanaerobacterium sp. RBIITD TaxID=1550240 RepID=UPI000BB85703|nr:radical SAM protein [Thermoanaerobacterium sp. RBIITD]SNX54942.1 nitrogen fixation protein NifB [Thermoanaerobacterium sp. RBIITD]
MGKTYCKNKVFGHPCFGDEAHFKYGRIHLPVAPRCNIKCNYCVRRHDCANENRPGVTTKIISPMEALVKVKEAIEQEPRIKVAAVAGPGDPLSNEATFETLDLVNKEFPNLRKCLSTNGLLLSDRLEDIISCGVSTLTITINAVDPSIGKEIYSYVIYKDELYKGEEAAEILINNQLLGLKEASEAGIAVKVNTVLIPSINKNHVIEIAKEVQKRGAYIMNVMPLIPMGKFSDLSAPTVEELEEAQKNCEKFVKQFHNCRQCRADAVGVPGEEQKRVCLL